MSLSAVLGPSGLYLSRCDGDLSLAGTPTRCAAWWLLDLQMAWRYGDRRGANRTMKGTPGARAQRRYRSSTIYKFRVDFGGRFTSAGAVSSLPPMQQLQANFKEARAAWGVDDPGGDSTVTSILTDADGVTTHSCPVQCLDLDPGIAESSDTDAAMRAILTIEVPRGGWDA